jgi:hypothetical protein
LRTRIYSLQILYTTETQYYIEMTTTSKLGDEFLRIPKLDVSGTNWVLYKERFFWALDARAILDHVDGTGVEPVDPVTAAARAESKLSDADKVLEKEWKS